MTHGSLTSPYRHHLESYFQNIYISANLSTAPAAPAPSSHMFKQAYACPRATTRVLPGTRSALAHTYVCVHGRELQVEKREQGCSV